MKRAARTAGPAWRSPLGEPLRRAIASRGLSAYAVGQLAGVDPGVVHRFLTGRRDIRLETADRLAAALGCRLQDFGGRTVGRRARKARTAPSPAPLPDPGPDADPEAS